MFALKASASGFASLLAAFQRSRLQQASPANTCALTFSGLHAPSASASRHTSSSSSVRVTAPAVRGWLMSQGVGVTAESRRLLQHPFSPAAIRIEAGPCASVSSQTARPGWQALVGHFEAP